MIIRIYSIGRKTEKRIDVKMINCETGVCQEQEKRCKIVKKIGEISKKKKKNRSRGTD